MTEADAQCPAAPANPGRFDVWKIYAGSNGEETMCLYRHLETLGPIGLIGLNLFRASKCSARAKVYRGGNGQGRYKDLAYSRKEYSIQQLCGMLAKHGTELGLVWGWKMDPTQSYHCWVLYVDLPGFGQVSFHAATPIGSQRYAGEWDGYRFSAERVQHFVTSLVTEK